MLTDGTRRRRRWRWIVLAVSLLTLAWPVGVAAVRAASLRVYIIPTGSMAPTLAAGDRVLVETYTGAEPRRGEVWIVDLPGTGRSAQAVKRVIGLPGETVRVASGRVWIDGRPLSEPYLTAPPSYTVPPTTLGPGQYFVLGDGRNASQDSHVWGPLPQDHLVGRVVSRCWPPRRIGGL